MTLETSLFVIPASFSCTIFYTTVSLLESRENRAYLFIFAIQDESVRRPWRFLGGPRFLRALSLCPDDLGRKTSLPQIIDRYASGHMGFEQAANAFRVIVVVGYEDRDISRRDKVGT